MIFNFLQLLFDVIYVLIFLFITVLPKRSRSQKVKTEKSEDAETGESSSMSILIVKGFVLIFCSQNESYTPNIQLEQIVCNSTTKLQHIKYILNNKIKLLR